MKKTLLIFALLAVSACAEMSSYLPSSSASNETYAD